jgi:hypothetical protein
MRILISGLILVLLASCGSQKNNDEAKLMEQLADTTQNTGQSISGEVIASVLQQIPSPLETSVLLKESGKQYNGSYLNSPDNLSKYNSNYKKALNLGIYGTDLGYTNIYEKNQDGAQYMRAIKDLADGLNIGQFFDVETIGRLATNSKNLDSLLTLTTQNFNAINHHLQTQSRENLSVLLLTGGWIEALHILAQVSQANATNKQLQETIGEQKIIFENIMLLLSFYKDTDQNMASLLKDMDQLKAAFDKVNITYTYKESTFEVVDGVMVIKDNSTSTVTITPEDVKNIGNITANIRSKIIS